VASEIQIVDTHESFETLIHTDFFVHSIQINRTLVDANKNFFVVRPSHKFFEYCSVGIGYNALHVS